MFAPRNPGNNRSRNDPRSPEKSLFGTQGAVAQNPFRSEFVSGVRVRYQLFVIWILNFYISPSACNLSLEVSKKLALRRSEIFFRPLQRPLHSGWNTGIMGCQEEKSKSLLSTFDTHYSNNPTFHHSMWIAQIYRARKPMVSTYCRNSETFNSRSELIFPFSQRILHLEFDI